MSGTAVRIGVFVPVLLLACDGLHGEKSAASKRAGADPGGSTPWTRVAQAGREFRDHWYDGLAELSGYQIVTPRYGQLREGQAAFIYVTEPHDRRTWIKVDAKEVPSEERVNVMKLNVSLDFLAGIYPYHVLTSVFSPVDDHGGERFRPARITNSVQEWCGHVHQVLMPDDTIFEYRVASYFDSEGEDERRIRVPGDALYEDALPIQLRELDGPFHGREDYDGWLVPSLWRVRRGHGPPRAVRATVRRSEADRGGVPVTRFELRAGDYVRTFDVEKASPRRILGWTTSEGERAELLDTARLPYWKLNKKGDEVYRKALGFEDGKAGLPLPQRVDERRGGLAEE